MKKWCLGGILFLCIGLFLLVLWSNPEFEIQTYQGTPIPNLKENNLPFQVSIKQKRATITVNGEPLKSGYYQPGTYTVRSTFLGKTIQKQVTILAPSKRKEYALYLNYATFPTLLSLLDLSSHDLPTYFWCGRKGTISESSLKNRDKLMLSNYVGEVDHIAEVMEEARTYVLEQLKKEQGAYFHLYLDDMQQWMEQAIMGVLGLTEDRYEVTYFSDGTYSYTKNYEESHDFKTFQAAQTNFIEHLELLRAHEKEATQAIQEQKSLSYQTEQVLQAASRPYVHYRLPYPELLKIGTKEVYEAVSLEKIMPQERYQSLTKEQQTEFFKFVNFDPKQFEQTYFASTDRPILIVTGSNPLQGSFTIDEFHWLLKSTARQYGSTYHLLYKPHPSAIPQGEEQAYLEQLGFQILPGSLPMEVLFFVYQDFKVGGFPSTLYLSVPKGATLFFYERGEYNLVSPLKELYPVLFSDVSFLHP